MGRPHWTRPGRTFYWAGALKLIPDRPTPLVVDHNMERQVGVVDRLFQMDWTDGPWICASATVTDPPCWLRRHDTKASFGRWNAHSTTHDDGWERVTSALVKEVSLLISLEPAEPLACVMSLREKAPAPVGDVAYGDGSVIRRPIGQVLGVR